MNVIDQRTVGVPISSKLKNTFKKTKNKNIRFLSEGKVQEGDASDALQNVTDTSSMLFLQEVYHHEEEKEALKDFGKNALRSLKRLHFDLLEGKIKNKLLYDLKNALNSNIGIINDPKLASVAQEISIRLEVEIAKIEMNTIN